MAWTVDHRFGFGKLRLLLVGIARMGRSDEAIKGAYRAIHALRAQVPQGARLQIAAAGSAEAPAGMGGALRSARC